MLFSVFLAIIFILPIICPSEVSSVTEKEPREMHSQLFERVKRFCQNNKLAVSIIGASTAAFAGYMLLKPKKVEANPSENNAPKNSSSHSDSSDSGSDTEASGDADSDNDSEKASGKEEHGTDSSLNFNNDGLAGIFGSPNGTKLAKDLESAKISNEAKINAIDSIMLIIDKSKQIDFLLKILSSKKMTHAGLNTEKYKKELTSILEKEVEDIASKDQCNETLFRILNGDEGVDEKALEQNIKQLKKIGGTKLDDDNKLLIMTRNKMDIILYLKFLAESKRLGDFFSNLARCLDVLKPNPEDRNKVCELCKTKLIKKINYAFDSNKENFNYICLNIEQIFGKDSINSNELKDLVNAEFTKDVAKKHEDKKEAPVELRQKPNQDFPSTDQIKEDVEKLFCDIKESIKLRTLLNEKFNNIANRYNNLSDINDSEKTDQITCIKELLAISNNKTLLARKINFFKWCKKYNKQGFKPLNDEYFGLCGDDVVSLEDYNTLVTQTNDWDLQADKENAYKYFLGNIACRANTSYSDLISAAEKIKTEDLKSAAKEDILSSIKHIAKPISSENLTETLNEFKSNYNQSLINLTLKISPNAALISRLDPKGEIEEFNEVRRHYNFYVSVAREFRTKSAINRLCRENFLNKFCFSKEEVYNDLKDKIAQCSSNDIMIEKILQELCTPSSDLSQDKLSELRELVNKKNQPIILRDTDEAS